MSEYPTRRRFQREAPACGCFTPMPPRCGNAHLARPIAAICAHAAPRSLPHFRAKTAQESAPKARQDEPTKTKGGTMSKGFPGWPSTTGEESGGGRHNGPRPK